MDAYDVAVYTLSIGWPCILREACPRLAVGQERCDLVDLERPLTVSKYHLSTSWVGNWNFLSCKSVRTDKRTGSLITSSLMNTEPSRIGMSVSCLDIVNTFVSHPRYSLNVSRCKGFVKLIIDKSTRIDIISLDLLA